MPQNQPENENKSLEEQIRRDITSEIFRAAKIPNIKWLRNAVSPFIHTPVSRFSKLIVEFDTSIKEKGYVYASTQILKKLAGEVAANGQEFIPASGPLIIASNHPGTYDGLAIISQLPRNDFRLIVSGIPFFQNLPNASKNLIFATHDTSDRMDVIRKSVRHLQGGGALLIFPSGRLDPDPSIYSDAGEGLKKWSRSIEVFLNKVPDAQLVLTIASGVLSREYINYPVIKLFRNDHEQRRILEFIQVIRQMALGKPVELHPKVTFTKPFRPTDPLKILNGFSDKTILEKAMALLDYHVNLYYSNR
jgi:hypothetical protein